VKQNWAAVEKGLKRGMWNSRGAVLGCLLVVSCTQGRSDGNALQTLFRSILAERDDSQLPTDESVGLEFSRTVVGLEFADIQALLPLADQCLASERPAIRGYGITFFALVPLRMDSSRLLEPYVDEIATLLNDPDVGTRNSAIFMLGSSKPVPLPRGIAYLVAHLGDKSDSPEQVNLIAGTLMASAPDAAVLHKVLTVVQQRPDIDKIKGRFIEILGISRTKNEEALAFIRDGLMDKNPGTRATSISAVEKMPKDVKNGFSGELQRIATSPDETPQQRDLARQVLIQ
jgi:HEAT repeat protein